MNCPHCQKELPKTKYRNFDCPFCTKELEPNPLILNFEATKVTEEINSISFKTSPSKSITLITELGFGPADFPLLKEVASIHFQPTYFSLVLSQGKERILFDFEQLENIRFENTSMFFSKNNTKFKIDFFNHPSRAKILTEMVLKGKNKTMPSQIPDTVAQELKLRFIPESYLK